MKPDKCDCAGIVLGALVAASIAMGGVAGVTSAMPGTTRDAAAYVLIAEVRKLEPHDVRTWLCSTRAGTRFRMAARDVLAHEGIDSSGYCD